MTRLNRFWLIAAAIMLPVTAAYAIDRLVLSLSCPDCPTETAKLLPLFDGTQDGLVRVQANTMEFRARVAGSGNADGEGVILLHGFPETSIMWEPLLEALRRDGYHAIAFDQRGYSPGARPLMENAYTKGKLANDVLAIADAAGFDKFHIIGHYFGGAIAWTVADRHRERVLSLTSLSMPHPLALADALVNPGPQWPASSYVLFYRLPALPEFIMGFDRAALLSRWKWQNHPKNQVDEYRRVFSEPGALHAALDWYRAFKFRSLDPAGKVRPPTLFLWGEEDGAFSRAAATDTVNYMDGAYRLRTVNAGHNLMLEAPDVVETEILAHLKTARQVSEHNGLPLWIRRHKRLDRRVIRERQNAFVSSSRPMAGPFGSAINATKLIRASCVSRAHNGRPMRRSSIASISAPGPRWHKKAPAATPLFPMGHAITATVFA